MYSNFMWATAQTGKNSKRLIHHMLSTFAIMGIPQQIKTDNDLAFTSSQFKTFCTYWGIPQNPQGQRIIERTHQTLKAQLLKQKATTYPPNVQLMMALTTLNIFNIYKNSKHPPITLHWHTPKLAPPPHPTMMARYWDTLDGIWKGPNPLLTTGRGFACIFPQDQPKPIWVPARNVWHYPSTKKMVHVSLADKGQKKEEEAEETPHAEGQKNLLEGHPWPGDCCPGHVPPTNPTLLYSLGCFCHSSC